MTLPGEEKENDGRRGIGSIPVALGMRLVAFLAFVGSIVSWPFRRFRRARTGAGTGRRVPRPTPAFVASQRRLSSRARVSPAPVTAALAFAALAAGAWLVVRSSSLPAPKGEDAPPEVFSAARAGKELDAIAGTNVPRPAGSAEALRVHDLIRARLQALGYAPVEQSTLTCRAPLGCAYVRNVLARTREPGPEGMTLVVAHYDSVGAGPGAGDDGSGTAILLEVARALAAAPLPATSRSVGFLFDEAEENGLFGATAFVEQHPWMKDVRSVVNIEARGVHGDSLLFEVIGDSEAVATAAAGALSHPWTNSVMATIYARMPNDTDLTVFREHGGVSGANLAFLGGVTSYHTAHDTAASVDRGTLQAQGDGALGLARAFADPGFAPRAFGTGPAAPSTWFDLLHESTLHVGLEVTWGLAGLSLLVALVALARVRPSGSAVVRALFGLLFAPLLAGGLATVVLAGAHEAGLPPAAFLADPRFLLGAFAAIGVASLALGGSLGRYARDEEGEVVSQLGWLLLALIGAAAAYWAPGTAYLFALPGLVAGLVRLVAPRSVHLPDAAGGFVLALVGTSSFLLLYDALGLDLPAALVVPPVVLFLPFAPLFGRLAREAVALSTVVLLGGVVLTVLRPAFTADAPERVNVVYLRDPGRASATVGIDAAWGDHPWGPVPAAMRSALGPNAAPGALLPWDAHIALRVDSDALPGATPGGAGGNGRSGSAANGAPAGGAGLEGSVRVEAAQGDVRIDDDIAKRAGLRRTVKLHLTPPPGGRWIGIAFAEPTAVVSGTLEGRDWPSGTHGPEGARFRFFVLQAPSEAARAHGVNATFTVDGAKAVEGRVFAVSAGVPAVARGVVDARPATASPSQDGDVTWVLTSQRF